MSKYLKKFQNQILYNISQSNLRRPNISLVSNNKQLKYKPKLVIPKNNYVEIGGIKWATMNVGANSITDYGLFFAWGESQGYTNTQVGYGSNQKSFRWIDYTYCNNTNDPTTNDMIKYNSTDNKTFLDSCDDAASIYMGKQWRMPTVDEYVALSKVVNTTWTDDYQGSGVAGMILTDKTDSSKVLFFPAAGNCSFGSVNNVGTNGSYWTSTLMTSEVRNANFFRVNSNGVYWAISGSRRDGCTVRAVLDEYEYVDLGLPSGTLWGKCNIGAKYEDEYGNYFEYGKGANVYQYSNQMYNGTEDPLSLSYDNAYQIMHGNWHVPTKTQFEELIANTIFSYPVVINGVKGAKFTSKTDYTKYVFFPYTGIVYGDPYSYSNVGEQGHYMTSTPIDSQRHYEFYIYDGYNQLTDSYHYNGMPIKPVIG